MKPHALGAGQIIEFILTHERNKTQNDDANCGKVCQIWHNYFKPDVLNHFK